MKITAMGILLAGICLMSGCEEQNPVVAIIHDNRKLAKRTFYCLV